MKKINAAWSLYGWIAVGLALIGYLVVVWHGPQFQELVCADGGKDCFREWVSALGGWAAVGAAIPTVFYLSRQVTDADRHNIMTFQITLRRSQALAKQTLRCLEDINRTLLVIDQVWETVPPYPEFLNQYTHDIEALISLLEKAPFQRFEEEIDVPDAKQAQVVSDLLKYLRAMKTKPGTNVFDAREGPALQQSIKHILGMVEDYVKQIEKISIDYLDYVAGATKS